MGVRAIAAGKDRARTVLEEHGAIIDGLRSGDSARAAEALAAHLTGTLAALHLPVVASWTEAFPEGVGGGRG